MDTSRFDQLARSLASAGARRGILRILAALPLTLIVTLLGGREASAGRSGAGIGGHRQGHRNRTARRHRKERNDRTSRQRKQKQKEQRIRRARKKQRGKDTPCQPESPAQTCADRCGAIDNNCGQPIDCGPCTCDSLCPACTICDAVTRTCQPDHAVIGESCGDGQACQQDGLCSCTGESCGSCRTCGADGACASCSGCCEDGQCVAACGCGRSCCDGVCCAQDQVCLDGACCTPQCDAVPCGSGAAETCGVASCGACAAGEICAAGACVQVCAPNPCPPECNNCVTRPDGTAICASFASASCLVSCLSDANCCPGQICGVHVNGICGDAYVCWNLEFNCGA